MTPTPSPLPLRFRTIRVGEVNVYDAANVIIAECGEEEDAALIIQAVNERAGLLALLRDFADNWDCDTGANGAHPDYCRCCRARAALNQAEK